MMEESSMHEKLFATQEIGSLKKPGWYTGVKKGVKVSPLDWELRKWEETLNIDAQPLRRILKRKPTTMLKREVLNWAVKFALRLQESAGLDFVWNGEFARSEMYEDFASKIPELRFTAPYRGSLAFDDNYYRPAECIAKIKSSRLIYVDEFEVTKSLTDHVLKVPITDAHTIATWSFNLYYMRKLNSKHVDPRKMRYEAKREFTLDLARGPIRRNIQALVEAGSRVIQLDGPAAITDLREFDRGFLRSVGHEVPLYVEAFNEATSGINCEFHVHICFPPDAGYECLFPYIAEMKNCSQFSLEYANRDNTGIGITPDIRRGYESLNVFREYAIDQRIGLGVVDVHTDIIESPELIRDRLLYASRLLSDPKFVVASTDCGLRTRSWDIAYQKLHNLVKGATMARENYS